MTEPTLADLHGRLNRLERELAGWRRLGITALACAGLFGAVAATVTTSPDEVKTRRLVITDADGRGRAMFTVDDNDRTRLTMTDQDGATNVDLTVTPGQSAALSVSRAGAQAQLAATGDNGQLSVATRGQQGWLVASPGGTSLGLGNDQGRPQVSIAISPTRAPSLQLSDRDGSAVWKAP
ncbi:MAG TPA: hypothetical protein VL086_18020 [Candidatus Nitrosotalea sp.]|jgi:hypothetical protein|nr:hypothetical protein [Candidatus Nitrosotalea sp.]